jgi:hypothetical protein
VLQGACALRFFAVYLIVRTFKNTWFTRFADKEGISDDELLAAVDDIEAGQFDADLGGGVFKQRIARQGSGKSGAYRAIVFYRSGDKTFFAYGFAKSDRNNITQTELVKMKKQAATQLSMTDKQIKDALEAGVLKEIEAE